MKKSLILAGVMACLVSQGAFAQVEGYRGSVNAKTGNNVVTAAGECGGAVHFEDKKAQEVFVTVRLPYVACEESVSQRYVMMATDGGLKRQLIEGSEKYTYENTFYSNIRPYAFKVKKGANEADYVRMACEKEESRLAAMSGESNCK